MNAVIQWQFSKKRQAYRLEPGGAVALASLLRGDLSKYPNIKAICVILSGGNVDNSIARSADEAFGVVSLFISFDHYNGIQLIQILGNKAYM